MKLVPAAALVVSLVVPATARAGMRVEVRAGTECPVELLRPAPGEVLEGGREVTLAWRERRDLAAAGIEEWEAFLSLDGGRQWPIRLTPHLDADLTSFRFTVPRLPSDQVRLMLRFGDERREVGYVLAPVWRVSDGAAPASLPTAAPSFGAGEVAGPDGSGTVLWLEGDRRGRRQVLRATAWQPPQLTADDAAGLPGWLLLAAPHRHLGRCAGPGVQPASNRHRAGATSPARLVLTLAPLLLLQCRRNE